MNSNKNRGKNPRKMTWACLKIGYSKIPLFFHHVAFQSPMAILEYVGYNRKLKPHKKMGSWTKTASSCRKDLKCAMFINVHFASCCIKNGDEKIMFFTKQQASPPQVATGRTQWELPSEGAAALSDREYDD